MRRRRGPTYYMCKKCQAGIFNRRFVAYIGDSFLINVFPTLGAGCFLGAAGAPESAAVLVNIVSVGSTGVFIIRDAVLGGAGPCKRLFGLTVVKHEDGVTPLSYGQAFVRWLGHLIPIFNLVDASRAHSDPLQRRFGDSWAKTRVLDTSAKVARVRAWARAKLQRKGIEFPTDAVMSLEEFARIDG
jgi:uncharacterized RDD family membrane protein YckC